MSSLEVSKDSVTNFFAKMKIGIPTNRYLLPNTLDEFYKLAWSEGEDNPSEAEGSDLLEEKTYTDEVDNRKQVFRNNQWVYEADETPSPGPPEQTETILTELEQRINEYIIEYASDPENVKNKFIQSYISTDVTSKGEIVQVLNNIIEKAEIDSTANTPYSLAATALLTAIQEIVIDTAPQMVNKYIRLYTTNSENTVNKFIQDYSNSDSTRRSEFVQSLNDILILDTKQVANESLLQSYKEAATALLGEASRFEQQVKNQPITEQEKTELLTEGEELAQRISDEVKRGSGSWEKYIGLKLADLLKEYQLGKNVESNLIKYQGFLNYFDKLDKANLEINIESHYADYINNLWHSGSFLEPEYYTKFISDLSNLKPDEVPYTKIEDDFKRNLKQNAGKPFLDTDDKYKRFLQSYLNRVDKESKYTRDIKKQIRENLEAYMEEVLKPVPQQGTIEYSVSQVIKNLNKDRDARGRIETDAKSVIEDFIEGLRGENSINWSEWSPEQRKSYKELWINELNKLTPQNPTPNTPAAYNKVYLENLQKAIEQKFADEIQEAEYASNLGEVGATAVEDTGEIKVDAKRLIDTELVAGRFEKGITAHWQDYNVAQREEYRDTFINEVQKKVPRASKDSIAALKKKIDKIYNDLILSGGKTKGMNISIGDAVTNHMDSARKNNNPKSFVNWYEKNILNSTDEIKDGAWKAVLDYSILNTITDTTDSYNILNDKENIEVPQPIKDALLAAGIPVDTVNTAKAKWLSPYEFLITTGKVGETPYYYTVKYEAYDGNPVLSIHHTNRDLSMYLRAAISNKRNKDETISRLEDLPPDKWEDSDWYAFGNELVKGISKQYEGSNKPQYYVNQLVAREISTRSNKLSLEQYSKLVSQLPPEIAEYMPYKGGSWLEKAYEWFMRGEVGKTREIYKANQSTTSTTAPSGGSSTTTPIPSTPTPSTQQTTQADEPEVGTEQTEGKPKFKVGDWGYIGDRDYYTKIDKVNDPGYYIEVVYENDGPYEYYYPGNDLELVSNKEKNNFNKWFKQLGASKTFAVGDIVKVTSNGDLGKIFKIVYEYTDIYGDNWREDNLIPETDKDKINKLEDWLKDKNAETTQDQEKTEETKDNTQPDNQNIDLIKKGDIVFFSGDYYKALEDPTDILNVINWISTNGDVFGVNQQDILDEPDSSLNVPSTPPDSIKNMLERIYSEYFKEQVSSTETNKEEKPEETKPSTEDAIKDILSINQSNLDKAKVLLNSIDTLLQGGRTYDDILKGLTYNGMNFKQYTNQFSSEELVTELLKQLGYNQTTASKLPNTIAEFIKLADESYRPYEPGMGSNPLVNQVFNRDPIPEAPPIFPYKKGDSYTLESLDYPVVSHYLDDIAENKGIKDFTKKVSGKKDNKIIHFIYDDTFPYAKWEDDNNLDINLYKVKDVVDLLSVLVHEFRHVITVMVNEPMSTKEERERADPEEYVDFPEENIAFPEMIKFMLYTLLMPRDAVYDKLLDIVGEDNEEKVEEWLDDAENIKKHANYPSHPNNVIIESNEYYPNGLKESDIWDYYDGVKDTIVATLKNHDVMLVLNADGEVYKRHDKDPNSFIRIASTSDFDHYNNGRTVEFHKTIGNSTDYGLVDIDPRENVPFSKVKKVAGKVYDLLSSLPNIDNVDLIYSGGRGFHLYPKYSSLRDTNELRAELNTILDSFIEETNDSTITTSIPKSTDQIRLDTSTLKSTGSLRVKDSLNGRTGLRCINIERNQLPRFEKKSAMIPNISKSGILNFFRGGK